VAHRCEETFIVQCSTFICHLKMASWCAKGPEHRVAFPDSCEKVCFGATTVIAWPVLKNSTKKR
jgi:hypothetical protein